MKIKRYLIDYAFLIGGAAIIIFVDQWTKGLVRSNLAIGEVYRPEHWLTQYARILHWTNTGAAFGMLQNLSLVFTILPFIISGAILYYYPQVPRGEILMRLALVMQLGGAIGNLIDRLTIGHVTDFISVGNFAVFNVADASITGGVGLLMLSIYLGDKKEKQAALESETQNPNKPEIGDVI